ncbi:MAG: NifB/NifX family molybdenum-iron cluster-binding protein [Campylobacterota bacterium]|nr:NifB/NifX family molybdenum-iron cluster-binding protein [Campylobacterota bacterium]
MKVAFPTNKGEKITRHASFCQSFLIVDTKTGEREIVDNPLKTEAKAVGAKRDKSAGRHLGSGRIISVLLAEIGVELYVYLEAEDNFLSHLQREGINIYATQEKQIDLVIKEILEKENMMNEEREYTDFGRGMGQGRGFGRRAGRGFGKGAGMGQGNGRRGGAGRGLGRGAGIGQRAGMAGDFGQDTGNSSMYGQGRGVNGGMGRGMGRGFGNR